MKKIVLPLIALSVILSAFMQENKEKYPTIEIGVDMPLSDYKMKSIDGKELSLLAIKKENGVCVIFSCNTCPFVVGRGETSEGWENRYNDLADYCEQNNIGMVLVNSNEAKRDNDDSFEKMVERAKAQKYAMPYVVDEDSKLANTFGAKTTPHVFLFDKSNKLVYKGAIDDNVDKAEEVKETHLKNAIHSLVQNKPITENNTKAIGCSIKRKG
jgi:thioredoxin-related protein